MPRVLLIVTTRSYRAGAFVDAARALGVPLTVASERSQALAAFQPDGHLVLDPGAPAALDTVLRFAAAHPLGAVIAADDDGVALAARACQRLQLPHHPPDAVRAARVKIAMRERFAAVGVPGPWFTVARRGEDAAALRGRVRFPCVVKPPDLSASRGVMRANDGAELSVALERLARMPEAGNRVLIEGYVPGVEVALEGLVTAGRLRTLALFDKPDPLEGPTFEETIYVTPSRLPEPVRDAIARRAQEMVTSLGLSHGPVHAELRVNDEGQWPIEIAPRSIGGWCSRVLRFAGGASLEMLLLRHALGEDVSAIAREPDAAGVMMIPVPAAGVFEGVGGVERARAVAGVEDVRIAVAPGETLVPLPESSRYVGFIFARAPGADAVEAALRAAHGLLTFDVRPAVPSRGETP
ncbi:MAG TPA: ATP-grasp domain-containing protein [Candidatus Eisenbacteria bacterium]|nr:ATP-grasp domain-containing protein [Candidatus Eisenbacteria bacterium]